MTLDGATRIKRGAIRGPFVKAQNSNPHADGANICKSISTPHIDQWSGTSPATQDPNSRHECAGVVFEIALVDAQKEDAIVRRREFGRFPHENEIVIVVADDRDQGAGRSRGDQFAIIRNGETFGAGALVIPQIDFSGSADHNALPALDADFGARPIGRARDADRFFHDRGDGARVGVIRRRL